MIFRIANLARYNSTRTLRCPFCPKSFKIADTLYTHVELEHNKELPEGISPKHYIYDLNHPGDHLCQICKINKCVWKEKTGRYSTICDEPACKEEARRRFLDNYKKKHGKDHSIDDPEVQREMLKHRKNSGEYKFSDGGTVSFASSYEEDFLKFCDQSLEFTSDFISECPINFTYMYESKKHYYLPDYYIKAYNLIIEIKADDEISHPKLLAVDKETEKLKDDAVKKDGSYNFIKICDKKYDDFVKLINILKDQDLENESKNKDIYIVIPEYKENEIKGFKMPKLEFISDKEQLINPCMEDYYYNNEKRIVTFNLVICTDYLPKELKNNKILEELEIDSNTRNILCRSSTFDYKDKVKFDRTFKEFTKYYTKKHEKFINQDYMTVNCPLDLNKYRVLELRYVSFIENKDIESRIKKDIYSIDDVNKFFMIIKTKMSLYIIYRKNTKYEKAFSKLLDMTLEMCKNKDKKIAIIDDIDYFIPPGIVDGGYNTYLVDFDKLKNYLEF